MNMGEWWWDTQHQLPTGVTILPVICASNKIQLNNFSDDQHTWPLYSIIGNIEKDIRRTPKKGTGFLVRLIPGRPNGAKNIDEAWHCTVGTVLSQLSHLDIPGPGFQRDCAY
jgi:hypothetical protein